MTCGQNSHSVQLKIITVVVILTSAYPVREPSYTPQISAASSTVGANKSIQLVIGSLVNGVYASLDLIGATPAISIPGVIWRGLYQNRLIILPT